MNIVFIPISIILKESLKRQLKLILEIDPKTPGEALAKELRQVSYLLLINNLLMLRTVGLIEIILKVNLRCKPLSDVATSL